MKISRDGHLPAPLKLGEHILPRSGACQALGSQRYQQFIRCAVHCSAVWLVVAIANGFPWCSFQVTFESSFYT